MYEDVTPQKKLNFYDFLTLFFVIGYLIIELFPAKGIRTAESQYLYLNILNIVVSTCIFFIPQLRINLSKISFKKNYIFWGYIAFFTLCCISALNSNNQNLSVFRLSQLSVFLMAFINLIILLQSRLYLIFKIAFLVGFFAFLQAGKALSNINFSNSSTLANDIGMYLRGNTGNINIFSASLLTKLPFMFIAILHYKHVLAKWFLTLSLSLSLICIFFINARASLLTLIIVFVVILVYVIKNKLVTKHFLLSKVPFLLLPFIAAFLYTNSVKKNIIDEGRLGNTSAVERLQQINSGDVRLFLWENAAKMTEKNPVLGIGIGNWSIEATPYEPPKSNHFSFHPHNDFMETFAETGVLNGVLYFSIFIALLFVNLRILFKKKEFNDKQTVALLALLLLIVYGIDAFFNFPRYRPTMQLAFILLLVISILNSLRNIEVTTKDSTFPRYSFWGIICIVFAITPLYVTYYSYQTMLMETKIYQDPVHNDITAKPKMKASDILNLDPKFPNILQTSTASFDEYIGTLFYVENNFDEALKYFDRANKINPYIGKADFYKYYIHLKRGQKDSAYIDLKSSFYRRAWNIEIYKRLLKMAIVNKDSTEIFNAYKHYNKIHGDINALKEAAFSLTFLNYNKEKLINFVKVENDKFPIDSRLKVDSLTNALYAKKNNTNITTITKKQLLIKNNLTNGSDKFSETVNLGYYYSRNKDYDKAIMYLKKSLKYPNRTDDGKIEFTIGLCYAAKRDNTNACEFLKIAADKNYPRSKEISSKLCK